MTSTQAPPRALSPTTSQLDPADLDELADADLDHLAEELLTKLYGIYQQQQRREGADLTTLPVAVALELAA